MNEAIAKPAVVELHPFAVTRKGLEALFGSPQLVRQLLAAAWIQVVRLGKPGREALFDYESAQAAYQRLRAGEEPASVTATTNGGAR